MALYRWLNKVAIAVMFDETLPRVESSKQQHRHCWVELFLLLPHEIASIIRHPLTEVSWSGSIAIGATWTPMPRKRKRSVHLRTTAVKNKLGRARRAWL